MKKLFIIALFAIGLTNVQAQECVYNYNPIDVSANVEIFQNANKAIVVSKSTDEDIVWVDFADLGSTDQAWYGVTYSYCIGDLNIHEGSYTYDGYVYDIYAEVHYITGELQFYEVCGLKN